MEYRQSRQTVTEHTQDIVIIKTVEQNTQITESKTKLAQQQTYNWHQQRTHTHTQRIRYRHCDTQYQVVKYDTVQYWQSVGTVTTVTVQRHRKDNTLLLAEQKLVKRREDRALIQNRIKTNSKQVRPEVTLRTPGHSNHLLSNDH